MLAIRMQRVGRRGNAQFRVIVQDSRFSPKSGRVVAYLGSYNPHTKSSTLDKDSAVKYLSNGAQPSDRVSKLLAQEGVKLPEWVKPSAPLERKIRHPEKLRKNRPAEAASAETPAGAPVEEESKETDSASDETAPENQASQADAAKETKSETDGQEPPIEAIQGEEPKPAASEEKQAADSNKSESATPSEDKPA